MRLACWLAAAAMAAVAVAAQGQTDFKPSTLVAKRAGIPMEPGAMATNANVDFLHRVDSAEQFSSIARIFDPGTTNSLPHAMFVIDRAQQRVYYANTTKYSLHESFLRGQRLVLNLDYETLKSFYLTPSRRFILGTVSHHPVLGKWLFEYWDGDQANPVIVQETAKLLASSFFAPLTFKANSTHHEDVGRRAGVNMVTQAQILADRPYLALNAGTTQGRLRFIEDIDDEKNDDIEPDDILVLKEVPLTLPYVRGIVLEQPSTTLSHVNVLAKGWNIPNIYLKDAFEKLRSYDGQWVKLQADRANYHITGASGPGAERRPVASWLSRPDLSTVAPVPLSRVRLNTAACGAKASRLGDLEFLRKRGFIDHVAAVPDGFCIPYSQFAGFMAQPAARELVRKAMAVDRFDRSRAVRKRVLQQLRKDLVELPVPHPWADQWQRLWIKQLQSEGVFVRSSSNSEDLANFSGAGLYSTVPNVKGADDLERAVKTVWASVFNADAFEARKAAQVPHDQVLMAVFVQKAIDSRVSGALVTSDPFDPTRKYVVYVSAKRGIGIRVVEGKKIAEQALYDAWSTAVQRFSRSGEITALQLDATGGLKEVPVDVSQSVLTDEQVRALAKVGLQVKQALGGTTDQDIEWAIDSQGRIVLLQARPFIFTKTGN